MNKNTKTREWWVNRLQYDYIGTEAVAEEKQLVFNIGDFDFFRSPIVSEVWWCEYSPSVLPEFGKRRPVVVLSFQIIDERDSIATIVPMTRKPPNPKTKKGRKDIKNAVQIKSPIGGDDAWVFCNHITTVSTWRLHAPTYSKRDGFPKKEFNQIQEIVEKVLEKLPEPEEEEKVKAQNQSEKGWWLRRLEVKITPSPEDKQLVFNMFKPTPKITEVWWCECSPPVLPEIGNRCQVVIMSRHSIPYGVVTVVPVTSTRPKGKKDRDHSVWTKSPVNGDEVWALCNHITTVSTERLYAPDYSKHDGFPKMEFNRFQEIVAKVLDKLPKPRERN